MSLEPIDLSTARLILDFSGEDEKLENLGKLQLEGAVALYNMIADPKVGMGYLADEVGMGKTYIALGVVSLMRYFNPTLRVLYICPSNNVQEKWHAREYRSFCKHNVKVSQYRIRTPDGKSAAPAISCRSVTELIRHAATGYYADFFVGMNAFSLALSKDDKDAWKKKLAELHELLPAFPVPTSEITSMAVKDKYAEALNRVLPCFDLVVIDEAHNFKHGFESSHRNRVLSAALGFRGDRIQRVKNALLLSATPYDRDLTQLRNQLQLVGHRRLLPDDVAHNEKERVECYLRRFMVRRLNVLQIAGKDRTRNMYRKEWRSGEPAKIRLASHEQKLVTALVQKKVGEMLAKDNGSTSFQTGLLASFESYAESTGSGPVEFDGELAEKGDSDAQDKHVIGALAESYARSNLGRTLPHPKMDSVSQHLYQELFQRRRKQIVFVRRVKSVKEIKRKLDDLYNEWLAAYIRRQLEAYPQAHQCMDAVICKYYEYSRSQDEDISGGDYVSGDTDDTEDHQPPKYDTLFAWFFRGELPADVKHVFERDQGSLIVPEAMRRGLVAKDQSVSLILEINWANLLARRLGKDLDQLLRLHGEEVCRIAGKYLEDSHQMNGQSAFIACQFAFLDCLVRYKNLPGLGRLGDHLEPTRPTNNPVTLSLEHCSELLQTHTLYCALYQADLLCKLFPRVMPLLNEMIAGEEVTREQLQTLDIHNALLSLCLRTGHGLVDLYLTRLRFGSGHLNPDSRTEWMNELVKVLSRQSDESGFNTYWECQQLAEHLDLIIKTNFPEIYDKSADQYRLYLARALNPVAPIMGATGDTAATRSSQARKFRMPGYPLALISTNVFQEGEDLHTFCDSVMHYGLSGSPVSIEQKIGRVDRVGSQAQRRLLAMEDTTPSNDDLIQVTYPFVQESIEVFQVRQLCRNINDFIRSLNTLGTGSQAAQDRVDADAAVTDHSEIPEQICDFLSSPYVPEVVDKGDPPLNREQFVKEQAEHTLQVVGNITRLLYERFRQDSVLDTGGIHLSLLGQCKPVIISLKAARASNEMLLHVLWEGEIISLHDMDQCQLRDKMQCSWNTYYRTYAKEIANRKFQLGYDAELLVGGKEATTPQEIDSFFNRFQQTHNPRHYHKPTSPQILCYWKKAAATGKADFGQFPASMDASETAEELGLTFKFGVREQERKHHVCIYELDGRCVFMAQAASAQRVEALTDAQIVRFTWLFNGNVDLAEFMLDDRGALVGRTVHPVNGMDYKEFAYCAYTLAVSTDRLEFLIQQRDCN